MAVAVVAAQTVVAQYRRVGVGGVAAKPVVPTDCPPPRTAELGGQP